MAERVRVVGAGVVSCPVAALTRARLWRPKSASLAVRKSPDSRMFSSCTQQGKEFTEQGVACGEQWSEQRGDEVSCSIGVFADMCIHKLHQCLLHNVPGF
jgi:hypothetical protein